MANNEAQWRDLMLLRMQQVQQIQLIQSQQQAMPFMPQFQQQEDCDDQDSCPEELRTLFLANLDESKVDEELLYELFLQAGPIEKVHFPKKKTFAFITYVHSCSPVYAMHLYQGVKLFGSPLVIKFKGTTNLPPLLRRLLPPECGIARELVAMPPRNPFSEPPRAQRRSFDNSALRNSHYAAFMDSEADDGNRRRDRSPQRYSRDRSNDIHRRHERSPPRRRQDKDSDKNWAHGPDRARSRSHHSSLPYENRRF